MKLPVIVSGVPRGRRRRVSYTHTHELESPDVTVVWGNLSVAVRCDAEGNVEVHAQLGTERVELKGRL